MGLNLKILKMSAKLFAVMTLYTENIADLTDHLADAFICEKVVYCYDAVTMLWHSKVYSWHHYV